MSILLNNAVLVDVDEPLVRSGSVLVEGPQIAWTAAAGETPPAVADETLDCAGKLLMPGFVIGHTHLYSSLAVGMPPPKGAPRTFAEILEQVWWPLDRALDEESVYMSALAGATRAALCGVSTLIDHHASPNAICGSLDLVRDALKAVGLRGVLCYEVTDRNGKEQVRTGIEENARFLAQPSTGLFAGMAGGHAPFTLSDDSLRSLAELAEQYQCGIHMHCAEDATDQEDSLRRNGVGVVQRLEECGVLRPESLLAHCTHLSPRQIDKLREAQCWVAHNPRSNMNNAVGYASVQAFVHGNVVLGTDGLDGDLLAESHASFLRMRDAGAGLSADQCLRWVSDSAQFAARQLKVPLGKLKAGYGADLVLLDYKPPTPLTTQNLLGHWFYGLESRHVDSLMVNGSWVVKQRELTNKGLQSQLEKAPQVAQRLWGRMKDEG